MINTFVNPIALNNIGWKYYIVFVALLLLMLVVVILFFAETKGHSLEEVADIFEGPMIVVGKSRRRKATATIVEDQTLDKGGQTVMVEDVGETKVAADKD